MIYPPKNGGFGFGDAEGEHVQVSEFLAYGFRCPLFWFVYWICCDIVVWSKALFEVNPVNYAGAVLSLAVVFAGSKISRAKNKETKRALSLVPDLVVPETPFGSTLISMMAAVVGFTAFKRIRAKHQLT